MMLAVINGSRAARQEDREQLRILTATASAVVLSALLFLARHLRVADRGPSPRAAPSVKIELALYQRKEFPRHSDFPI